MKVKCSNCKYIKFEYYGDSKCTNPINTKLEYEGTYNKTQPYCRYINLNNDCKDFKPNLRMKFKMFIGRIQKVYYMKKHPEWFLKEVNE